MATANGKPLAGLARAFAALQGALYKPPANVIAGVDPKNFPTANQPVMPVGPPGSRPLAWSYWEGINQNVTPRPDAALTFQDLRQLATYPLARLLIESVKDQVSSIKWTIQLREKPGESLQERRDRQKSDSNIPKLIDFLDAPDGETPWPDWVRRVLEDLLVIDAPAILLRSTLTGKVVQWRWTDGADILRLIDDQGCTPAPPSPAYTQLWEGVPRLFLTSNQLLYRPRNIVPRGTVASQLYGYGPVEGQAEEIKVGQKRLESTLMFYTEGAVPGLVHMVPPGVPVDKILEAMQWMNSELSGNLAALKKWRMVQSFGGDQQNGPKDHIEQLKEPILADVYDDLHIRKLSFAFGVSAQRLLKQMNRASAEANQESAQEEGLLPWVTWLKGTIDTGLRRMGMGNYETIPDTAIELDPVKQSAIDSEYVKSGIRTINEVRDARGLLPRPEPEANQLGIVTPTGWIPVAGATERTEQAAEAANRPKPVPTLPGQPPRQLGDGGPKKKVTTRPTIDPGRTSPQLAIAHAKVYTHVARFLHDAGKKAAAVVAGNATAQRFAKADKPDKDEIEQIVDAIMGDIPWADLVDLVEPDLTAAAVEGAEVGVDELDQAIAAASRTTTVAISPEVISEVNAAARDYAEARAAELVGMKWVDGELVENPNAQWAITDSTRNMLRTTISDAFAGETTMETLTQAIRDAGAFSEERARLIAVTEVNNAQVGGNYAAWEKSGLVEATRWVVSMDHEEIDECDENAEAGPVKFGDEFPSGAKHAPAHPRCRCICVAAKIKGVSL